VTRDLSVAPSASSPADEWKAWSSAVAAAQREALVAALEHELESARRSAVVLEHSAARMRAKADDIERSLGRDAALSVRFEADRLDVKARRTSGRVPLIAKELRAAKRKG
jgi:hypothetical protein